MGRKEFLERKLKKIKDIMGYATIVRVGIRKSGEIDILSADNVGINSEENEDFEISKEPCDYIG